MDPETGRKLREWAEEYNDPKYFKEDPIAFPTIFAKAYAAGTGVRPGDPPCTLQDVETAAVFAAHFAWGRRTMIVRDCGRLFDEMNWRPYDYVMSGEWRHDPVSVHRTVKWCDVADICSRLRRIYSQIPSLEPLSQDQIRTDVFGQKSDPKAPNKKINMMRRWMVRRDGKVDLGLWLSISEKDLLIPLDVHVHDTATALGLTSRKQKDITTVREITDAFLDIFPSDPCKGDFSLFGYGVTHA